MDRGEPTFVPEWYKGSTSGTSGSSNSNHHSAYSNHHSALSSHLDDHGVGHSSRNRLLEHDAPRSSVFLDRSSLSFRRSVSSNGSLSHDKDSPLHSQQYGGLGRCHRDRDREKDNDLRDRDRPHLVDGGFCDYSDSFIGSRSDKDTLRRSHSMVSGKRVESLPKRPGNDLKNGILSGVSIISGISKTFLERDFPSLGAEEKPGPPEIGRVSSPGLSSAIQNLPKGIGGDGWTSALVDIPGIGGGNGPAPSSTPQTGSMSLGSTASTSGTGLNMAETLAQAPSRVRTPPQLSIDNQRIEERTRLQYSKLIPVTPSMPKSSALSSSEKSKVKGARSGDLSGASKVGQQSSQFVNLTLRAPARTDSPKASQVGNFQVLNRERNGISPTAKDGPSLMNPSRTVTVLCGVQTAATLAPKSPVNPKLKSDSKAGSSSSTQSSFGEKKSTQAQNRNDFFNFIRKKTPMNHSADPTESSCAASSCSVKLGEQITVTSTSVTQENDSSASCSYLEHPVENGNGVAQDGSDVCEVSSRSPPGNEEGSSSSEPIVPDSMRSVENGNGVTPDGSDVCEVPSRSLPGNEEGSSSPEPVVPDSSNVGESSAGHVLAPICASDNFDESPSSDPLVVPSEEELALLRRLGWDENAEEGGALTPEEINEFVRQYEARRTSLRTGQREIRPLRMVLPDSGQSGVAGNRFN